MRPEGQAILPPYQVVVGHPPVGAASSQVSWTSGEQGHQPRDDISVVHLIISFITKTHKTDSRTDTRFAECWGWVEVIKFIGLC